MGKPQQSIFKCKHCPKEFKKQGNFENHMKYHKMPMIFMCAKCRSLFNSSSKLEDHITSEHLKLESLDCNKCGDTFKDEASFKSHKCKEITQNIFTCDKCSRSFKYLRNLKNHEKVHNRQKKEDLHSCQSCPKMFASDAALKKHGQIHDIKLKYSTGFKKSGIQIRNSINVKQKSARKSMRAVRTHWCHVCNCGCTDIDEFKRHIHRHQKAKGNVLDKASERAQKKTHLAPSKSIKKYNSPSKKYKTTKQANHLENSKQQVVNFKIESEGQQTQNIKTEGITDYNQEQPILFDGNQISVGLAQSNHLGGMYNNFIQPVQQFSNGVINGGNMPNVQFISVTPSQNTLQNDLKSIPKFDFFSEKYMNWLKTFINKCKCQKHPFSHTLVKKIAKVNYDLYTALIDLKSKKDHFYLMNLYKSLESVMYNNVQYELTESI